MAIEEVLPNSVVTNTSNRFLTEGGTIFATAHVSKVSDNSDTTFASQSVAGGSSILRFGFPTPTINSNQRVRRVRMRARALTVSGQPSSALRLFQSSTQMTNTLLSQNNTKQDRYGDWAPKNAAGTEWTATELADLEASFVSNSAFHTLYRMVLQLDLAARPVVQPSYPGGSTLTPPRALFMWGFDGDGSSQAKIEIKFFSTVIAEGGGFDPATSTPVATYSGTQNYQGLQIALTSNIDDDGVASPVYMGLTRGTAYYWAIRAAVSFNGADWWSEWSTATKFTIRQRPTATGLTPSGTLSTTTRPTIAWTYTEADASLPQNRYAVKIFQQPSGSWPAGFNPGEVDTTEGETFPPIAFTGTLGNYVATGANTSWLSTKSLENLTEFRAYVKVRRAVSSVWADREEWSTWAYTTFNVNVVTPVRPTSLGILYSVSQAYIELDVTTSSFALAGQFLEIQRSIDGGLTWEDSPLWCLEQFTYWPSMKRWVPGALPMFGGTATFRDYEAPFNTVVSYRVRTIAVVSGSDVASDWLESLTTIPTKAVWLKIPTDPSANRTFPVIDDWWGITRSLPRTIHRPLGRNRPIIMKGQAGGDSFTVNFLCLGFEEFNELMALVTDNDVLLLQNERKIWFVQTSGDVTWEDYLWDTHQGSIEAQKVSVPFIEVDR